MEPGNRTGWATLYVGIDSSFVGVDLLVHQGHFSVRGAKRFADDLAPIVRQHCR